MTAAGRPHIVPVCFALAGRRIVTAVDAKSMTVKTEFGDHKGNVINVIPPQTAGEVARRPRAADA